MATKKKAASKRSTTSRAPARNSARGSVQKFLEQTGRSENDVVRFSDLRALEGVGGSNQSDTASPPGDGTDGAGAVGQGATS